MRKVTKKTMGDNVYILSCFQHGHSNTFEKCIKISKKEYNQIPLTDEGIISGDYGTRLSQKQALNYFQF